MTDAPRPDDQATIDVANADLLLSTTRSVRKRLDFERPVERETLLECLELAVQAPTASNRQTWRWMIVTDDELKRQIADVYREQGMDYLRNGIAQSEASGNSDQQRVQDTDTAIDHDSDSDSGGSGDPGSANSGDSRSGGSGSG